jgi:tetratricopeptide (TPR) repeat protein
MVEVYRAAYDDHHYLIGIAYSNLASVYTRSGDSERAEANLLEALARFEATLPPDHLNIAIARIKLGELFTDLGRYAQAEEQLRTGYDMLVTDVNPAVHWLTTARRNLTSAYDALGDRQQAARFAAELAEVDE